MRAGCGRGAGGVWAGCGRGAGGVRAAGCGREDWQARIWPRPAYIAQVTASHSTWRMSPGASEWARPCYLRAEIYSAVPGAQLRPVASRAPSYWGKWGICRGRSVGHLLKSGVWKICRGSRVGASAERREECCSAAGQVPGDASPAPSPRSAQHACGVPVANGGLAHSSTYVIIPSAHKSTAKS